MKLYKINFNGQVVPFKLKISCSSTFLLGCNNGEGDYILKDGEQTISKQSEIDGFNCYKIQAPDDATIKTYVYTDGNIECKVIIDYKEISKSFVDVGGGGSETADDMAIMYDYEPSITDNYMVINPENLKNFVDVWIENDSYPDGFTIYLAGYDYGYSNPVVIPRCRLVVYGGYDGDMLAFNKIKIQPMTKDEVPGQDEYMMTGFYLSELDVNSVLPGEGKETAIEVWASDNFIPYIQKIAEMDY